jgi:hypothetical protein
MKICTGLCACLEHNTLDIYRSEKCIEQMLQMLMPAARFRQECVPKVPIKWYGTADRHANLLAMCILGALRVTGILL